MSLVLTETNFKYLKLHEIKKRSYIFHGAHVESAPGVRSFKRHALLRLQLVHAAKIWTTHRQTIEIWVQARIRSIVHGHGVLTVLSQQKIELISKRLQPKIKNPKSVTKP